MDVQFSSDKELVVFHDYIIESLNSPSIEINNIPYDMLLNISDNTIPLLSDVIAALPKTTVDPYSEVLIHAGLSPLCFEIESQAVSRSLIKNSMTINRALIVDLGATRTGLLVFAGHSMRFTSSSQVCGSLFDQRISNELNIDLKK